MATDADDRSQKKKKRKQAGQDRSGWFDWGEWLDLWLDWDEFKRYWYIKIPVALLGLGGFALVAVRLLDEPPTWNEFGEQLFATYEQLRDMLIQVPLRLFEVSVSDGVANLLLMALVIVVAFIRAVSAHNSRDLRTTIAAAFMVKIAEVLIGIGALVLLVWGASKA